MSISFPHAQFYAPDAEVNVLCAENPALRKIHSFKTDSATMEVGMFRLMPVLPSYSFTAVFSIYSASLCNSHSQLNIKWHASGPLDHTCEPVGYCGRRNWGPHCWEPRADKYPPIKAWCMLGVGKVLKPIPASLWDTPARKLKKALSRMASRQNWVRDQASHSRKHKTARPQIVYTDGSVTKDQSGWGFTVKQGATTIHEDSAAS